MAPPRKKCKFVDWEAIEADGSESEDDYSHISASEYESESSGGNDLDQDDNPVWYRRYLDKQEQCRGIPPLIPRLHMMTTRSRSTILRTTGGPSSSTRRTSSQAQPGPVLPSSGLPRSFDRTSPTTSRTPPTPPTDGLDASQRPAATATIDATRSNAHSEIEHPSSPSRTPPMIPSRIEGSRTFQEQIAYDLLQLSARGSSSADPR